MDLLNNKIDELREDLLQSIITMVQIPSVEDNPEDGYPFGKNVGKALEKALEISSNLGFETTNLENYIGYAEYGESEGYICVIGHVDVVADESGWTYKPYGGEIVNGRMYGRGVLDNKGPIISALYGLYAIKELNIKLHKKVRIIFGTNEESGFKDIPYYLEKEISPIMGFTPDCKYPVVYGEKGMARLILSMSSNLDEDVIISLLNNVSEKINITYKNLKLQECKYILELKIKYDFSYKLENVIEELKDIYKSVKLK